MILYYISEALRAVRQSKLAATITTLSVALAVLAAAGSIFLIMLSGIIDRELKERIQVDVFLRESINQAEIETLRNELSGVQGVNKVEYISSSEAEKIFLKETGEDFSSVLEVNPLPPSFKVSFDQDFVTEVKLQDFVEKYNANELVDEIIYDYSTVISILNFVHSSRIIIFAISFLLMLFAVYLVYSTNKLQIQNKLQQINTMKLVGAKLSTIKGPLYLTGLIYGIIGGVICLAVVYLAINFIQTVYINFNFEKYFYLSSLIVIILGLIFGLAGSLISSRSISLKIEKL